MKWIILYMSLLVLASAFGKIGGKWYYERKERLRFEEAGKHLGINVTLYPDGSFKYDLISSPRGKLDPYKIYLNGN